MKEKTAELKMNKRWTEIETKAVGICGLSLIISCTFCLILLLFVSNV